MVYRSIQKYTTRQMNIVPFLVTIPLILLHNTSILLANTSNSDFSRLAILHLTSSCQYVTAFASNMAEASRGFIFSTEPLYDLFSVSEAP